MSVKLSETPYVHETAEVHDTRLGRYTEISERCRVSEEERLQIQKLFPLGKVFAESFNCDDDPEEFIRYTNVNAKVGFLAVHAGATLKQANKRLSEVKATGKFPGANIRKMQAVIVFP